MSSRIHILDGPSASWAPTTIATIDALVAVIGRPDGVVFRSTANDTGSPLDPQSLILVDVERTASRSGFACRPASPVDVFANLGDWVWWEETTG